MSRAHLISDIIFTAALGCVAWGCWLAWPPLGLIVPGSVVCGVMLYGKISRPPSQE